jgi:hypothetical protein
VQTSFQVARTPNEMLCEMTCTAIRMFCATSRACYGVLSLCPDASQDLPISYLYDYWDDMLNYWHAYFGGLLSYW